MRNNRLKQRREELSLTQADLGEAVGVEAMTVSRWERGFNVPRPRYWPKLRKITRLSIADLIGLHGEPAE